MSKLKLTPILLLGIIALLIAIFLLYASTKNSNVKFGGFYAIGSIMLVVASVLIVPLEQIIVANLSNASTEKIWVIEIMIIGIIALMFSL
jgi:hypothetical protein